MCRTVLDDEDLSRHFLSGQNPFSLRRVTSLPPNFEVTDDVVADFLHRGLTLAEEIKVGIYVLPTRVCHYFTLKFFTLCLNLIQL